MNLHEIEKLVEKYFAGETTLSEEDKLRDFFSSGEVPEKWNDLVGYFRFFSQEKEMQIEDADFDRKVMAKLKTSRLASLIDIRRPWIYWISGVAASVLILIAIFVKFDPFSQRFEDTYKDPQAAYTEARKILLYVSSQFNKGTSTLKPVGTLETGLNELKPVSEYSKSLKEVDRLNEVDKVEKMIKSR